MGIPGGWPGVARLGGEEWLDGTAGSCAWNVCWPISTSITTPKWHPCPKICWRAPVRSFRKIAAKTRHRMCDVHRANQLAPSSDKHSRLTPGGVYRVTGAPL